MIKTAEKFIQTESHSGFDFDIFREFLFDESNDFFYAHIAASNDRSYFYKIDPYENEEVNLQHESYESAGSKGWNVRELVCSFYREGKEITFVKKPSVEIASYVMNNTFVSDLTFSSQCTVSFKKVQSLRESGSLLGSTRNSLSIRSCLKERKYSACGTTNRRSYGSAWTSLFHWIWEWQLKYFITVSWCRSNTAGIF